MRVTLFSNRNIVKKTKVELNFKITLITVELHPTSGSSQSSRSMNLLHGGRYAHAEGLSYWHLDLSWVEIVISTVQRNPKEKKEK